MENTAQSHKDPLEVHKENMKLLKVLPISGNRSVPNSPMTRRAADREGEKQRHLSPSPQRKDFLPVSEDSRTKCLTHLGDDISSNRSPKESPVGLPSLSVSEKLIRTHFLSNTTGKTGSYLLRKSDEIIKKKSPTGSPRFPSSPIAARKTNTVSDTSSIGFHVKHLALPSTSMPIATRDLTNCKKTDRYGEQHKQRPVNSEDDSDSDSANQVEQHLEDVRKGIGAVLSKTKSSEQKLRDISGTEIQDSKVEDKQIVVPPIVGRGTVKPKPKKLHQYIVYGDTGLSPGYLSPPLEPRGSMDLSAEMELWKQQERRKFEDLDCVDETSNTDSANDREPIQELEKQEVPAGVFTMPPVFANVTHTPKARDFSIPVENQEEINEEDWSKMKKCRYLRMQHSVDDSVNNDEDEKDSLHDETNDNEIISDGEN